MKKIIIGGLICLWSFFPAGVLAHGDEEHEEHGGKTTAKSSITGEVVDVTCYLMHPESGIGPNHAKCAKECIDKGLPVAIKSGNRLYLVTGAKHNPPNKMLSPFAAKQVKATGEVKELDGLSMIFIENVEEARR